MLKELGFAGVLLVTPIAIMRVSCYTAHSRAVRRVRDARDDWYSALVTVGKGKCFA